MKTKVRQADYGDRKHHRLCPSYPGAKLKSYEICCDCIYGMVAAGELKAKSPKRRNP